MNKVKTFEEKLSDLESIIESLENDELSLDDSISQYKKGLETMKFCTAHIEKIEKELEVIKK